MNVQEALASALRSPRTMVESVLHNEVVRLNKVLMDTQGKLTAAISNAAAKAEAALAKIDPTPEPVKDLGTLPADRATTVHTDPIIPEKPPVPETADPESPVEAPTDAVHSEASAPDASLETLEETVPAAVLDAAPASKAAPKA